MSRAFVTTLWLAVGALGAGGCTPEGTVELAWQFPALPGGDGEPETAAAGCGNHGIDSLLIAGRNDGGDGANIVASCTAGWVRRSVPAGSWSFSFHTLDIQGRLIRAFDDPDAVSDALAVAEDGTAAFPTVTLPPRPACGDTVDNDRDGRIDLDDPECAGNAAGTDESTAAQP
jgi:hypothetical protein